MNKTMKNKVTLCALILIVFSFNLIFSQKLSDNWKRIKSDNISEIFLDPTKIVEYGNEISVWAFEKLVEPKTTDKNEKIYSIKTHYLFNKMKKRFAEIGVIYYGAKGGIVNRSSKSSFNGGPTAFTTPISASKNAEVVYKEVISYLITGNVAEVDSKKNNDKKKLDDNEKEKVESKNEVTEQVQKEKKNVPVTVETESKELSVAVTSKVGVNSGPSVKTNKLENNKTIDISSIPKSQVTLKEIDRVKLPSLPEIKADKNEYNLQNERAMKNAIFTDGNLFCFQVSSWKTKSYADREVKKLLAKGYNAFLVSVKPKHKHSIWHRVRVGYFNSLNETKRVQRKIR